MERTPMSERDYLTPSEAIEHWGISQRKDGKYMFKYVVDGKTYFLTSWKLLPLDRQPKGTKPTLSLREMEKERGQAP